MGLNENMAASSGLAPAAKGGEVRQPDADYFNALQTEVNDKGFLSPARKICSNGRAPARYGG